MRTKKNKGLYIHIPFCDEICPYCGFSHILSSCNKQNLYINRLKEDILKYQNQFFSSIYIGGGTPSSLNYKQLEELLKSLQVFIHKNISFSFEANPQSLDLEKIKLLAKYNVNRISIGVQTFQKPLQKKLMRFATYSQIKNIIEQLHQFGINDINLDLMYGINGENLTQLENDLKLFTSLDIKHISCYCLQVEEHTIFYNQKIEEMNQDDAADEYQLICEYLKKKGFIHYEISNFAKKGYESKHNLLYWHNDEYVGLGISSAGYENNIRYVNENSLTHYLNSESKKEEEILSILDIEKYYIILNLRLAKGINFLDFKKKFHKDFLKTYEKQIEALKKYDYLKINKNNLYVKEKYFFILNTILLYFF